MRITIRSKLIFAISTLMVVLFGIAAYLFITEKEREMADDIYMNSLAFARLTAPTVAYDYDLYLAQNSFVYFNREIASVFEQNDDVSAISVVSYSGEKIYDSDLDANKKYSGEARMVTQELLSQIQSENISVKTKNGRIVFMKTGLEGDSFVDGNENKTDALKNGTLVEYFVVPANEKYSVVYTLDYHNLDERVTRMMQRIIYLALFGIMLGMILSFFMSAQVSKPVAQLVEEAGKIAKGDFKARVDIQTRDELKLLGQAFNKMAGDLEASIEAKLYKERVTRELQLATQIQQQLIPKEIPKIEGLDIAACLIPASEIGGDIYDFIPLGDKRMMMYLGDVTGHGVPAGIVSSIANALFYGYAPQGDLKKILVWVNHVLKAKTMSTMFMTLCLMDFDAESGKFLYANAGHEQIIHYKASEKKVELKPAGGLALGMVPDISAQTVVQEVPLEIGDFLVVYSDGIPEAWKNEKEKYGMERLEDTVQKFGNTTNSDVMGADAMMQAILADVKGFCSGHEQMDDITIIVLKKV